MNARAAKLGISIDEALRYCEQHYRPDHHEITVLSARERFLESRKTLSKKTQSHYSTVTNLLLKPDPNKPSCHRTD